MHQLRTDEALPSIDPISFRRIADLVFRHTGIRLGPGKSYFVEARLGGLYRALGCSHWGELPSRFDEEGASVLHEALVRAVVTQETRFFRDELPFRALRDAIVPAAIVHGQGPTTIRVWSAGCSTGQEPYSVVMSLWDFLERGEIELEVWATDICEAALDRARIGAYEAFDLERGLDPESRRKFFEDSGCGVARVREEVRRRVRFDRLNLARELPKQGGFHAVLCRNVAIYFDRQGKQRLYRTLGSALLPSGYLILGAAETLFPGLPGFETVYFGRSLLFRKRPGGSP